MIPLPAKDLSPNLLEFITQQQALIARQQEQIAQQQEQIVQLQEQNVQQQIRIEALETEITRLKKLNPKPDIKPNTTPPDDDDPGSSPPAVPQELIQPHSGNLGGLPPRWIAYNGMSHCRVSHLWSYRETAITSID